MDKLFPSHKQQTDSDFKTLWEKGLIVCDANVLLDLYRLPESAQQDLISIFSNKKIRDRIWLPFQVALEYTHNKVDVISDQKNKFNEVRKILTGTEENFETAYATLTKKIDDLQLKKRHSLIDPEQFINDSILNGIKEKIKQFQEHLNELEKKQQDVNDNDRIGETISELFNDKIGERFSKEKLEALYKEGEKRYNEEIPPGYKDKVKEGFYMHHDSKFLRKYGDLILWEEIIQKCQNENTEHLLLVTGDVKEDWWREKRGKKLGPRYELLNEIYYRVRSMKFFHIYDSSNFMKYAKEYAKIDIKQESINETIELEKSKIQLRDIVSRLSIRGRILKLLHKFPLIEAKFVGFGPTKKYINIPVKDLQAVLMETLSNVSEHALGKTVTIKFLATENYALLSFTNHSKPEKETPYYNNRGTGLTLIGEIMSKYGEAQIRFDGPTFYVNLYFQNQYVTYGE
jgi:hypothetical protein